MFIDIVIPTYNRRDMAERQIIAAGNVRKTLAEHGLEVELIVSDNHTVPPVTIPAQCADFTKLIRPEQHLHSGEENLLFALTHCTGEYIWTLSDDDALITKNVLDMLATVASEKPDLLVAGSSAYLKDGKIIKSQTICSDPTRFKSLPQFVSSAGIWFTLAGFS